MLVDITTVRVLDGYMVELCFEDGVVGTVDIAKLTRFHGVFEPLRSLDYFRQVQVLPEQVTIGWPNGLDLDPDILYALATGQPIPDLTPTPTR